MTLIEFLLTRIDEDEAQLIAHRVGCRFIESDTFDECDCGQPARALAECEAKRRIIEFLRPTPDMPAGEGQFVATMTLQLLARPYADHPDYRDEWRAVATPA